MLRLAILTGPTRMGVARGKQLTKARGWRRRRRTSAPASAPAGRASASCPEEGIGSSFIARQNPARQRDAGRKAAGDFGDVDQRHRDMAMVVDDATQDGLAIELERQQQCVGFIVGQLFEDCWPGLCAVPFAETSFAAALEGADRWLEGNCMVGGLVINLVRAPFRRLGHGFDGQAGDWSFSWPHFQLDSRRERDAPAYRRAVVILGEGVR